MSFNTSGFIYSETKETLPFSRLIFTFKLNFRSSFSSVNINYFKAFSAIYRSLFWENFRYSSFSYNYLICFLIYCSAYSSSFILDSSSVSSYSLEIYTCLAFASSIAIRISSSELSLILWYSSAFSFLSGFSFWYMSRIYFIKFLYFLLELFALFLEENSMNSIFIISKFKLFVSFYRLLSRIASFSGSSFVSHSSSLISS